MTGEQGIGKGGDQVKFDRTGRTAESTAEDSVVTGDRKQDHQQRHREIKDSGRTFQGMNRLYQQETGNLVDNGSGALNEESVTIIALNPEGNEVKASGKTGLTQRDLDQAAALPTSFRHDHTVKTSETEQEMQKGVQNLPASGDRLAHDPARAGASDKIQIADRHKAPETETERYARTMKDHYETGHRLEAFLQRPTVHKAKEMLPTFAQGIKELRECKWKGDIRVWIGSPIENPDYSAGYSLIEIDSQARSNRQLESFAHEAYHATHQDLDKLYGGQKPVSSSEFVSTKMHQEAGAFYREAMVNEELTSLPLTFDKTMVQYVYLNSEGKPQTQSINDLIVRAPDGKPDEAKSLAAIETFLRKHTSLVADLSHPGSYQKDKNGKYRVNDYVAHYNSGYKDYFNNFAQNQKTMRDKHYL